MGPGSKNVNDLQVDLPGLRSTIGTKEDGGSRLAGSIPASMGIQLAERAVIEGRDETAARLLDAQNNSGTLDAGELCRWGRVAEALGRTDEALRHFEEAIGIDAGRVEAHLSLARTLFEIGRRRAASRALQRALGVGVEREVLIALAEELRSTEIAPDENDPGFLRSSSSGTDGRSSARERIVERFLSLFSGRRDCHARQWYDPEKGRCGYGPVRGPIGPRMVVAHLKGSITLGAYLLDRDNRVRFAAIDIDIDRASLPPPSDRGAVRRYVLECTVPLIARAREAAAGEGLRIYFEYSGWKGVHGWTFFDPPISASSARDIMGLIAGRIHPLPADVSMEIFPKQDALSGKGFGNLIKLPLGVHRRMGLRGTFLDDSGRLIAHPLQYMIGIEKNPAENVEKILKRHRAAELAGRVVSIRDRQDQQSVREQPDMRTGQIDPVGYESSEGLALITNRCTVLGALVRKVREEGHLTFVERKVILQTLGHLERGNDMVHRIISKCRDYDPGITGHFISRLSGTPLGCRKIRRFLQIPEDDENCRCSFVLEAGEYASPVHHVDSCRLGSSVRAGETGNAAMRKEMGDLRGEMGEIRRMLECLVRAGST